jgi:hypothetical protein
MTGTPDAPAWLRPAIGVAMPDFAASHDAWEHYAVARGMPAAQAAASSRDQLVLAFVPLTALRDGPPRVEQLDRDPATRAAVREARR